MTPWITVIGIGADGIAGLDAHARDALSAADLIVGGERHQDMVPGDLAKSGAERKTWHCGIENTVKEIGEWRGRRVAVLVTGDPMNYGAGATLARHFDADDMVVMPHVGAFSLACARMIWSVPDVVTMTVHGRALNAINLHVRPGARIVALSWNGETPETLARILAGRGFGPSRLTVFSNMGGDDETRCEGTAEDWRHGGIPDFNTVCVECIPGPDAVWWPRTPGLPEEAYLHDSQITKREVRAATLAALGPFPGELLWDVGAGSGSVGIEWLRAADGTRAVAIEREAQRAANIRTNAENLGVPRLEIVEGGALDVIQARDDMPDAVFVGGGHVEDGLLDAAFAALRPGGRLVANAVTLEGEVALVRWGEANGARFTRLSAARSDSVGRRKALRPMMDVLQLQVEKP